MLRCWRSVLGGELLFDFVDAATGADLNALLVCLKRDRRG